MRIAAFFQTRVFVIIAASLAAVAIFVLVAKPPEGEVEANHFPIASTQSVASPRPAHGDLTPPADVQAILEPQRAPRPPANADLNDVFPPSRLPEVATAQGASISLACLAKNGADLSKPMPSKHCLFAANDQAAARVQTWATANGFEVRDIERLESHTGTTEFRFNLVRVEVPVPETIEREGRMILATVRQIPGTYYQTWSGEIVH